MLNSEQLLQLQYPEAEIKKKREKVRRGLLSDSKNISGGKITSMAQSDLVLFFKLYDEIFLDNYFRDNFEGKLSFKLSTRMTSNAGKIVSPKNLKSLTPDKEHHEIRIGIDFFFSYYDLNRDKKVNGIITKDSLEAFQLVFEHELCHLIELHFFRESNCKKPGFAEISYNLFGHTATYHMLPTAGELAAEKYGFNAGDEVSFNHEGKIVKGFISRINKRVTVMVPDNNGSYKNKSGERFSKWYVPFSSLKKG